MTRQDKPAPMGTADGDPLRSVGTEDLLAEIGRRFRVRFGKIEATFHDGRPSSKVLVEHRIQQSLHGAADRRPPLPPGGQS